MDKLKENAYWISLGAVVVVLLLLAWFLIVDRIFGGSPGQKTVTTLGTQLERLVEKIEAYTDREVVPTEDYEEYLRKKLELVRLDRNDGARFYNDRMQKFNEYFDGSVQTPDFGKFASLYFEKLDKIVKDYRERFDITPPEVDENERPRSSRDQVELPPKVHRFDQSAIIGEESVARAMKEYWITKSLFDALEKLEIGGLQEILFEGRDLIDEEETEYIRTIDAQVTLEMPFSKIEDLITELFRADRVLFLLDGFSVEKKPEHLAPNLELKTVQVFENRDEADRAKYEELVPEPNVSVVLRLKAFEWKGMALLERAGEDGELSREEFVDPGGV